MALQHPQPATLQPWLRSQAGFERASVTAIEPFEGGASNITCRVSLVGAPIPQVVLRMQRERGIFEPYDVIREGRVIAALHGSAVPVPALIASEPSGGPLGSPFIVLEWVDAPHMGEAPDASFHAYTEAVVAIHRLDWQALGLGFLGIPGTTADALASELDAVALRLERFGASAGLLLPAALARLRETAPGDGRLALCQGDINVFNYLFRGGRVLSVVDWEQARISDPRSDVGQLVALSHLKGAPFGPPAKMPFVQLYEAADGQALPGLEWFRARWLWELGVIYHGWKAFNSSDPWYTWPDVCRLLEASLAEL